MAATDKTFRNQRVLDIVFAASCAALLLSCLWMFADDYYREFKPIQRKFRDVETVLNERQMLADLPEPKVVEAKEALLIAARKDLEDKKKGLSPEQSRISVALDKTMMLYQGIKAHYDSRASHYDIAVEHRGHYQPKTPEYEHADKEVQALKEEVDHLKKQLDDAVKKKDEIEQEYRDKVRDVLKPYEDKVNEREDDLKRLADKFNRFAKATAQKSWTIYDSIRTWPIIDGFASPTKINQIVLNDLTIDYGGFRDVPRYDRCTTCHLGIDRALFSKERLEALAEAPHDATLRLRWTRRLFQERKKAGESLGFDLGNLPRSVSTMNLNKGEVTMYAAHPRLDLFVDSNSPHPMEKIGCTICHAGQGSATSFNLAAHTPADYHQEEEWKNEHGWSSSHFWDFPMLSSRFVESSCLKCHHQVTDLIRKGTKEEAPKLLKGYNLVRELGCYGCHEIAGQKSGRQVGPDLRLEPAPALDLLSTADQEKARSDPANPPGTYRKVGPSLRRLAEKTNETWTRKWINLPRDFRPDTRMPHFYNLTNNSGDALPDDQKTFPGTEVHCVASYLFQESKGNLEGKDTVRVFLETRHKELLAKLLQETKEKNSEGKKVRILGPLSEKEKKELDAVTRQLVDLALLAAPANAARIHTLATDLKGVQDRMQELLQGPEATRRDLQQQRQVAERSKDEKEVKRLDEKLQALEKEFDDRVRLDAQSLKALQEAVEQEKDPAKQNKLKTELAEEVENSKDRRLRLRQMVAELEKLARPTPLSTRVVSWDGQTVEQKTLDAAGDESRGRQLFTEKGCLACHSHQGTAKNAPGDAHFGPNLSRLRAKLVSTDDKDSGKGRRWLIQWILNPNIHHPRTRMPITQLSQQNAVDIANWLLSQPADGWTGQDPSASVSVSDLKKLARVYLFKAPGMTEEDMTAFLGDLKDDKLPPGIPTGRLEVLARDAEEQRLAKGKVTEDALKWYVGKKAITRMGCYACHDTPGFEQAKPIGVALNDWGKKDPERLAFEDSVEFVRGHFNEVDSRDTPRTKARSTPNGRLRMANCRWSAISRRPWSIIAGTASST